MEDILIYDYIVIGGGIAGVTCVEQVRAWFHFMIGFQIWGQLIT